MKLQEAGENCIMSCLKIIRVIKIKEDEMKRRAEFWLESLKERAHLEDLSIDGRITLRLIF
jgi:hypothetical protein